MQKHKLAKALGITKPGVYVVTNLIDQIDYPKIKVIKKLKFKEEDFDKTKKQ